VSVAFYSIISNFDSYATVIMTAQRFFYISLELMSLLTDVTVHVMSYPTCLLTL